MPTSPVKQCLLAFLLLSFFSSQAFAQTTHWRAEGASDNWDITTQDNAGVSTLSITNITGDGDFKVFESNNGVGAEQYCDESATNCVTAINLGAVLGIESVVGIPSGASNPTGSFSAGDLYWNTASNEFRVYDGSAWVTVSTASAENVTGASNEGTSGVGVFDNKNGTTLEFRNIAAGSSKVSITEDLINKKIDINVVPANINTADLNNDAGFITATLTDEEVQDKVGAMVTGNTETGVTVTYEDTDGTLDFVLDATGDWTGTLDGQEGSYYLDRANHTGSQNASTIVDFNDAADARADLRITATDIEDLNNVTVTSIADNQVLTYDSATTSWINESLATAGIAAASHTHVLADVTDSGALAGLDTVGTSEIEDEAVTLIKIAADNILTNAEDDAGGTANDLKAGSDLTVSDTMIPTAAAVASYVTEAVSNGLTAGDGIDISGSVISVRVDDSTIEIVSGILGVKAEGITTSHIADDTIAFEDLANATVLTAMEDGATSDNDLEGGSDTVIPTTAAVIDYVTANGDNLGNHTAEQDIDMAGYEVNLNGGYLSGDGDDEGLSIGATGDVTASGALVVTTTLDADGNTTLSGDLTLDGADSSTTINDGTLSVTNTTAATNSVVDVLTIAGAGGTVTEGIGAGISIHIENNAGEIEERASIDVTLEHGTNDGTANESEDARMKFSLAEDGTVAERMILYSNGDLDIEGALGTQQTLGSSDERLKENIEPVVNALDKLSQINGVSFTWIAEPENGVQLGVTAQNVETVFPQLVREGRNGYKRVDYSGFVAPLVEAVKTLKAENTTLKAQNKYFQEVLIDFKNRLETLENNGS